MTTQKKSVLLSSFPEIISNATVSLPVKIFRTIDFANTCIYVNNFQASEKNPNSFLAFYLYNNKNGYMRKQAFVKNNTWKLGK